MRNFFCLLILLVPLAHQGAIAGTHSTEIQSAAQLGKTTYVMFHRNSDPAARRMAATIDNVVNAHSDQMAWVNVNVNDPAAAELIERFDATRIPLPAVFGLAPNGAVTGVFRMRVSPQQLRNAMLTPKNAEMIKALQDQMIAVVVFQPSTQTPTPSGVDQFQLDPDFPGQVVVIRAAGDDPLEGAFFERMKVNPRIQSPLVSLFVPPGTHLGTFDANVAAATLAEKVHSSGQCNCEKCQQGR